MPDELVSAIVAAQILHVSDETIRRWVAEGLLRHVRLPSGQVRFWRSDIEAILEPVEPTGDAPKAS